MEIHHSDEIARLRKLLAETKHPKAKGAILSQIRKLREDLNSEEDALRQQIRKCRACGLGRKRGKAVPWSGPARGRADLVIAGEAPGADEDWKGIPFVGRSGKLLDRLLRRVGSDREHVYVCNTLCCRPPDNRDPNPGELKACRPNFEAQLEMSGCLVGVTLGGYAFANVKGVGRTTVTLKDVLNQPTWIDGRIWVPTYHPAYALRNRSAEGMIAEGLTIALAIAHGKRKGPYPPLNETPIDGVMRRRLGDKLEKFGWAAIHSDLLGDRIVIVRDDFNSKMEKTIPLNARGLSRYTLDELMKVGLLGRGDRVWTKEAFRNLHTVRDAFRGEVVFSGRQ